MGEVQVKTSRISAYRVGKALEFIHSSFDQTHLNLASTAKRVGLSPCYLSALFTRITGVSFKAHLRAVRLSKAESLLKNLTLSVKEVAAKTGYKHVSTFDRDFRSQYGKTPLEFRCSEGGGGSRNPRP